MIKVDLVLKGPEYSSPSCNFWMPITLHPDVVDLDPDVDHDVVDPDVVDLWYFILELFDLTEVNVYYFCRFVI